MKDSVRIYKFDNIKFFCMLLVVIGHIIALYTGYAPFASLFLIIYSFHMPMFIFIFGLFTKRKPDEKGFHWQKFTYFILVGFLLKFFTFLLKILLGYHPKFYWLNETRIPWFMFALAAYTLFVYLIRRLPPFITITASVLIAGLAGYCPYINDFLSLSRILVFLPFFLAGYYLTPEKVISITSKLWIKITSIVLTVVYCILCCVRYNMVSGLKRLFLGRYPYESVSLNNCGILDRYLVYIISAVFCIAIISIIPNKKIPLITKMGGNTLGTFFWHRLFIYLLDLSSALPIITNTLFLKGQSTLWVIFIMLLGIGITLLFSLDIFTRPLNFLKKQIYKCKTWWCLTFISALIVAGIVFTFFAA